MTRTPARIALRLFLALATVHLVWQLTGHGAPARVSQWFLMPVLAGFVLVSTRGTERGRLVRLTLTALFFSWLGDTAPSLVSGDTAFLVMVGFFLVAQVVYLAAFWPHRAGSVLHRRRALLIPYVVAIAVLVLACAPHAGPLLLPVLAYGLLLGAMAVLATGRNSLTWAGGALFLVSDGLIALNAFAPWWSLPGQGFWVMLTYIAAQLLLVLGVLRSPAGRGGDRSGAPVSARAT